MKEMGGREVDLVTWRFAKWLLLPFIGIIFVFIIYKLQINQWKCEKIAKDKGYLEGNYIPGNRGVGKACICSKKIRPDGTIDNNERLVIDLN